MLINSQSNSFLPSGNLILNIEFRNSIPRIVDHEFKPVEHTEIKDRGPKVFHSHFLAVDRWINKNISAIDALVLDLCALAGSSPEQFLTSLEPKIMGRERAHIARTRAGVYPLREDLALSNTVRLFEGWYLGKNISNREKYKILKAACDLKNLRPVPAKKPEGYNKCQG